VSSGLDEEIENLDRRGLIEKLQEETQAQSAWTAFYHQAVADRLHLNPTDHKCLDLILKCHLAGEPEPMTPGALARITHLTTGAVTGVLDRLEHAGFVKREHDPQDRRRVIVRPTPERIQHDVAPIFEQLSEGFKRECSRYTDEELRLLIGFARRCQALLQEATRQLRELG